MRGWGREGVEKSMCQHKMFIKFLCGGKLTGFASVLPNMFENAVFSYMETCYMNGRRVQKIIHLTLRENCG